MISTKAVLWWIPLYLTSFFGGLAYIIILYRMHRAKNQYTPIIEVNRVAIDQQTMKDVSYYKRYPLLYIIVNVIPILSDTIDYWNPNDHILALSVIATIIKDLQGVFIAIAITLDPRTRKRLNWKHF